MRLIAEIFWFIVVIAIGAMLLGMHYAVASPNCPTYQEIRAAFPKDHHWWYRVDGRRCWTNRREAPRAVDGNGNRARRATALVQMAQAEPVDMTDRQWQPKVFWDDVAPFAKLLDPANYDPMIMPDARMSGIVVWGPTEFNPIDAVLDAAERIEAAVPPPVNRKIIKAAAIGIALLIGLVVLALANIDAIRRRLRRRPPPKQPSIVDILRRIDTDDAAYVMRFGRIPL